MSHSYSRKSSSLPGMDDAQVDQLNKEVSSSSGDDDKTLVDTFTKYDPVVEEQGVADILAALDESEQKIMSDINMPLRHFRAEKTHVQSAIRKIKNTIAWRKDFGVETIRTCFDQHDANKGGHNNDDDVKINMRSILKVENDTGKIYARGYDLEGRSVLYFRPGMENTRGQELNNMRHLVYNLERGIACSKKNGHEKLIIIMDYKGFKLRNAPSMSTTQHTLTILQDHYPERLHRAYICNPPLVFRTFWSICRAFVDPHTKDKIVFCHGDSAIETLAKSFDLETTEKCACGTKDLREFVSKEYLAMPMHLSFDDLPETQQQKQQYETQFVKGLKLSSDCRQEEPNDDADPVMIRGKSCLVGSF